MSVLIKGMEMPKNCFMCYLSRLNGERLFCNVTDEEVLRYKIAPECPMTEVTETAERKRGKWIYQFHEDEVGVTGSECRMYEESFAKWIYDDGYRVVYNYCPYCGAEMESADDV